MTAAVKDAGVAPSAGVAPNSAAAPSASAPPPEAAADEAPKPLWKRAALAVWDFLGEHWFILGLGETIVNRGV
jgi:hypothetical protein